MLFSEEPLTARQPPIDLGPIRSGIKAISVNNAIDNEDWCFDFSTAADNIRNFLDKSSAIAEQFIDIFEGMETVSSPIMVNPVFWHYRGLIRRGIFCNFSHYTF